jgi:hypothetical protein
MDGRGSKNLDGLLPNYSLVPETGRKNGKSKCIFIAIFVSIRYGYGCSSILPIAFHFQVISLVRVLAIPCPICYIWYTYRIFVVLLKIWAKSAESPDASRKSGSLLQLSSQQTVIFKKFDSSS